MADPEDAFEEALKQLEGFDDALNSLDVLLAPTPSPAPLPTPGPVLRAESPATPAPAAEAEAPKQGFFGRVGNMAASAFDKFVSGIQGIDDAAESRATNPSNPLDPLTQLAGLYHHGWSPAWDYALRPTFSRAEEAGQLALSPVIQSITDLNFGPETVKKYLSQGKAFGKNLRAEDGGFDFRGATEAATDTGDYSRGVVGTAGVIGDPLNLVPGIGFTKLPRGLVKTGRGAVKAGDTPTLRGIGAVADLPAPTAHPSPRTFDDVVEQITSEVAPTQVAPEAAVAPDVERAFDDILEQLPEEGSPIAQRMVSGDSTTARVPEHDPYLFETRLVDLDDPDLLLSHDAVTSQVNLEHPLGLQFRDRTSQEMRAALQEMRRRFDPDGLIEDHHNLDEGIPIIAEDGGRMVAESGNGRLMAIRGSDQTYSQYRTRLEERAGEYGFAPEDLARFNRPALVRVRQTPLNPAERKEFIEIANESHAVGFSASEQAATDATRITPEMLVGFESAEEGMDALLHRASNRGFVRDFIETLPKSERPAMTDAGNLSQHGERRIQNAILARVFGEGGGAVVRRFFQSTDPGVKQVQNAITRVMPRLFSSHRRIAQGEIPESLDITSTLRQALDTISNIQAQGGKGTLETRVADHIAQSDAFSKGLPEVDILMDVMGKSTRSFKPLADMLDHYLGRVMELPNLNTPTMPGLEVPVSTQMELLVESAQASAGVDTTALAQISAWRKASQEATGLQDDLGSEYDKTMDAFGQSEAEGSVNEIRQASDTLKDEANFSEVMENVVDDPVEKAQAQATTAKVRQTTEIAERVVNAASGAPPPKTPPPTVRGYEDVLDAADESLDPDVNVAIQRQYEGKQNVYTLELEQWRDDLERTVYRGMKREPGQFTWDEVDQIMEVMHGERTLPEVNEMFHPYIKRIQERIKLTEARKIDFYDDALKTGMHRVMAYSPLKMLMKIGRLPDEWLTKRINPEDVVRSGDNVFISPDKYLSIEVRQELVEAVKKEVRGIDYAPRLWAQLEEEALRETFQPGTPRPGSTYGRGQLSFKGMREKGQVPKFQDPAAFALFDAQQQEAIENTIAMMHNLRMRGLLRHEREVANNSDWRVPKVGRPFEGALLENNNRSPSWAVARIDAEFLERMKDQSIPLYVGMKGKQVDVAKAAYKSANGMKFTKFILSPMQLADMTFMRMLPGYLEPFQVVDSRAILHLPSAATDTVKMLFNSAAGRKRLLRTRALEDEPLTADRPQLTMKFLIQNGLSVTADRSVFVQSVKRDAPQVVESWMNRKGGVFKKYAKSVPEWVNSTLFDVFYTNYLLRYARDVTLPQVKRQHSTWGDDQIASEVARLTNQHFSSFGEWQAHPVLRGATATKVSRAMFLSVDESRSWIGRTYEMLPIPGNTSKQFWMRNMLGILFTMEIMHQGINYAAKGKFADLEHLAPLKYDPESEYSGPFGFDYSSRFMRPVHPWAEGKGGRDVYVDLPAQLDTPLRLLDFPAFVGNRTSVPVRMIYNQLKGEDYFGQPLDEPQKKIAQGIADLAPIFVGSGMQAARSAGYGKDVIPEGESRLGEGGQMWQAFGGFNLSAETNAELRNRYTDTLGFDGEYADLEPYQKRIVHRKIADATDDELGRAARTAAERGQDWGQYKAILDELNQEQAERLEALADERGRRQPRDIVQAYFDIESEYGQRRDQARSDFGIEYDDPDADRGPMDEVLDAYHSIPEQATDDAGNFWYDEYRRRRDRFLRNLTGSEKQYILRNTNLTRVPPRLLGILRVHATSEYRRISGSTKARQQHLGGMGLRALLDR